ncbi:FKBP-type peptidyl-prolyl cis-trans isomerase [Galenea microaerophila]
MKKTLIAFSILLLSSTTALADNTELKTVEQKASYTLGADLAKNFIQQGIDIDNDALLMGFEDALKGRPLKLTQQEMNDAIEAFKKKIMAQKMAAFKALSEANKVKEAAFFAENKGKPGIHTTASGLQYKIIKEGKGPHPTDDSTVIVHYEGRLLDGTVFDSSYKRGTPLKFQLDNVILGWKEAIKMMRPGSIWEIYIPSKLAYGEKGAGKVIGPNEPLIFKVELLTVENPEKKETK